MYPYQNFQSNQVVRVTGEAGARAYQMMPNSSALLLDETAPLVWLVQTDGAGYKTLSPYTITIYKPEPEPDLRELMARITRLEDKLNESYFSSAKPQPATQPGKSDPKQFEGKRSQRNDAGTYAEQSSV